MFARQFLFIFCMTLTAPVAVVRGTTPDRVAVSRDAAPSLGVPAPDSPAIRTAGTPQTPSDSLWLLDTRRLTTNVCRADLQHPGFRISRLDRCGRAAASSLAEYLAAEPEEVFVIYIHGNRMEAGRAAHRGLLVYRRTMAHRCELTPPVRWLIWSWPSAQEGLLLSDAREKAQRTDSQGLYLAWLMRELIDRGHRPRLIGYSFGGRIATGGLHALGGGNLAGRSLPPPHIQGAHVSAGLIAPALGEDWLCAHGYHGGATRNLASLTILYNRRDAVLKRYPFLDPGSQALGYRGPQGFGPRYDGSRLPVRARNCAGTVGRRHVEADYYLGECNAGAEMYRMLLKETPQ
ncbi:hypothetical protein [Roseimaritima sediminicola]|uniref:hypothetical protein n=1 Tax=Roseimaritima sediminicola TaxID=2662066 RepID=UPI0012982A62|nr:hypothetical protein [Roseimaritima sediminicola]